MHKLSHLLAASALMCCGDLANAADMGAMSSMDPVCPAQAPDIVMTPKDPPDGTMVSTLKMLQLSGSAMEAGTPRNKRQLVPQAETTDRRTYVFEPADGKRWLMCEFGGREGTKLALRIDDKATTCTLSMVPGTHPGSIAAWAKCQ